MKKFKQATSLILALVMVLCLSISAFATNNSTASIVVTVLGEEQFTLPVTVAVGMTVKDALDQNEETLETVWKVVPNTNPNISATTAYAAETICGFGTDPQGAASGITAQFWSTKYPGYGIESMTVTSDKTVYHYIYAGYDWVYTVNGNTPVDSTNGYELYMDQCYITAGDTIELNYDLQITRWDSEDYWLTE